MLGCVWGLPLDLGGSRAGSGVPFPAPREFVFCLERAQGRGRVSRAAWAQLLEEKGCPWTLRSSARESGFTVKAIRRGPCKRSCSPGAEQRDPLASAGRGQPAPRPRVRFPSEQSGARQALYSGAGIGVNFPLVGVCRSAAPFLKAQKPI